MIVVGDGSSHHHCDIVPVAGCDVANVIIIVEANKINLELKIERIQLGEKRIGEGSHYCEVMVSVVVVHGDVLSVVGLIGLGWGWSSLYVVVIVDCCCCCCC